MSNQPNWSRAVWLKGENEQEAVILTKWISVSDNSVHWPHKINALRAENEDRDICSSWKTFPLVKIKVQSGIFCTNFTSCIFTV